jgi:hypothetical protein
MTRVKQTAGRAGIAIPISAEQPRAYSGSRRPAAANNRLGPAPLTSRQHSTSTASGVPRSCGSERPGPHPATPFSAQVQGRSDRCPHSRGITINHRTHEPSALPLPGTPKRGTETLGVATLGPRRLGAETPRPRRNRPTPKLRPPQAHPTAARSCAHRSLPSQQGSDRSRVARYPHLRTAVRMDR